MSQPIVLVPLDERPVNTRYPQMLGEIASASVLLPPAEIAGIQRTPADLTALVAWLRTAASGAEAVVASCDYLAYGNLINARISNDGAAEALARLSVLREINATCPVHVFSLITRVANANDCVEEPLYWLEWGQKFYRYANLAHRVERGVATPDERDALAVLEGELPSELRADWMTRRLRNHTINLGLLEMAARDQITSLLLTNDDTSPFGFPTRERDWLLSWPPLVSKTLAGKVQAYPGADEVGSALVARTINGGRNRFPKVWIEYAIPDDRAIVAPYEDRPVEQTVLGQIRACGCAVADAPEEADFVLGVVTPSPRRSDYRPEFLAADRAERSAAYSDFLATLAAHQQARRKVAIGDVAYPNGGDPLFTERLFASDLDCDALAAYGAWNTAGNTLGVVVAQAALAIYAREPQEIAAQKRFLAHRFLEDAAYQGPVRRAARQMAQTKWGRRDPDPESEAELTETVVFVADELEGQLAALQSAGIGTGLEIAPGSVRLPWRRLFEVDFTLREKA